jgi:hypothetical protein
VPINAIELKKLIEIASVRDHRIVDYIRNRLVEHYHAPLGLRRSWTSIFVLEIIGRWL